MVQGWELNLYYSGDIARIIPFSFFIVYREPARLVIFSEKQLPQLEHTQLFRKSQEQLVRWSVDISLELSGFNRINQTDFTVSLVSAVCLGSCELEL
jgi:hypothetical protein